MDQQHYCDLDSDVIEVTIRNHEGGNTFSSESVQKLFNHLAMFIGSRLVRKWQNNSGAPKIMKVTITVEIE